MIESSMFQALIALSQNDNLSKAAQELGVTQSAVSQTLKNLEQKLGFPILARQGKSAHLTDNGMKLAKVAKLFLKRIDDTIEQIHLESKSIKGKLHVGSLYGLGKTWLSSRVLDFMHQYPDLDVRLTMDFPENLIKKFEAHDIDCLILPEYQVPTLAEKKDLHQEYMTLVFPKNKNFNITSESTLKEIINYPIIFYDPHDPTFFRWCREKFKVIPRHIKPRLVVNSFGQMLQAVKEGIGIAVVPTHVLNRSHLRSEVSTLGKEFEIFSNKISYVYHSDESNSMKINELYKFLLASVKDIN